MNALKKIPFVQNGIGRKEFALLVMIGICIMALFLMMEDLKYFEDYSIVAFCKSLPIALIAWFLSGNALGIVVYFFALKIFVYDVFLMFLLLTVPFSYVSYMLLSICRCHNMGVSGWRCLVPFYNPLMLLVKKSKEDYCQTKRDLITTAFAIILFVVGSAYTVYDYWNINRLYNWTKDFCPHCKSTNIARFSYGLYEPPQNDTIITNKENRIRSGEVVLGGCVVEKDSPTNMCNDCGCTWGHFDLAINRIKKK